MEESKKTKWPCPTDGWGHQIATDSTNPKDGQRDPIGHVTVLKSPFGASDKIGRYVLLYQPGRLKTRKKDKQGVKNRTFSWVGGP